MLKVLIVGLGGVGQRHVRNLRSLLGEDVSIIAYRVRRLAQVVTASLGVKPDSNVEDEYNIRVYTLLEDALAESPAIAFICNPSSLHVSVAMSCARAGCDLFIEKPVAADLTSAALLLAEVQRQQRIAVVGYQLRFHPAFRALEQLVRYRSIGSVLAARVAVGEYLPGWHPYEDYRQMYASRAELGGGVVLSQIHEFDYLYALFGLPRRIFSIGGHLSDLEIDVEDVASSLMEFEVDERPTPVHVHQDYLQRPTNRSCELVGSSGKAVMDLAAPALTWYQSDGSIGETQRWEGWNRNDAFVAQLEHFLDCVTTRRKPLVDLADGIASLRMAVAAKESMVTGRVVTL